MEINNVLAVFEKLNADQKQAIIANVLETYKEYSEQIIINYKPLFDSQDVEYYSKMINAGVTWGL